MSIVLLGSTSGSITLSEPAVAGTNTLSLPAVTGTFVIAGQNSAVTAGTAVSASSTSVDFTSIPSWVKRITVMFSGVSTNGSSEYLIQIGNGSVQNTGYVSTVNYLTNNTSATSSTAGFILTNASTSSTIFNGTVTLCLLNSSSNIWVSNGVASWTTAATGTFVSGGTKTLSGTLDRVRITTVNGTDTFDAGSINILYE